MSLFYLGIFIELQRHLWMTPFAIEGTDDNQILPKFLSKVVTICLILSRPIVFCVTFTHGLRTSNEGINQRYQKNWADVADKICFARTGKSFSEARNIWRTCCVPKWF